MNKSDLSKTYKHYYRAKTKPELVHIEPAHFFSIRGKGDPSGKIFAEKIQALYTAAYAIKFLFKARGKDFTVAKLEGLWWYDEKKFGNPSIAAAPQKIPRSEWEYRLLIRFPDFVTGKDVQDGIQSAFSKKQIQLINEIELYEMNEGRCVQMLHIGPFHTEPESLSKMDEFIKEHRLNKNGLHHEIYLSDFRKISPDKMKTILREPVF